jgi:superoxide reductase
MSQKLQVFKCDSCGSVVESLRASDCDPSCCGKTMRALAENSTDAAQEKHLPVIERRPDGVLVRVGSAAHPMESDHYIEWIELLVPPASGAADGSVSSSYRAFLKPGDKPEAFFPVTAAKLVARELCNKHGLWKA